MQSGDHAVDLLFTDQICLGQFQKSNQLVLSAGAGLISRLRRAQRSRPTRFRSSSFCQFSVGCWALGVFSCYDLGGSLFLINDVKRSIGRGKKVVVLCSLEISRIVCRKRSCSAIGSLLIIAAACTIFSAA